MEQSVPLFLAHLRVGIAENKLDRLEEIALARAIAPDNDIVLRREGFCDCLVFVARGRLEYFQRVILRPCAPLEPLNYDLFDKHLRSTR